MHWVFFRCGLSLVFLNTPNKHVNRVLLDCLGVLPGIGNKSNPSPPHTHAHTHITCLQPVFPFIAQVSLYRQLFFFLKIFIYLRHSKRERVRGGHTGRGRSRLPAEQGASHTAGSQNLEIMTWAKGRCLTDWATEVPHIQMVFWTDFFLNNSHYKVGSSLPLPP